MAVRVSSSQICWTRSNGYHVSVQGVKCSCSSQTQKVRRGSCREGPYRLQSRVKNHHRYAQEEGRGDHSNLAGRR
eukprot:765084-Amphidinium_carterae.3